MKMIIYNAANSQTSRPTSASIRIHGRSGAIYFNQKAIDLIGLEERDGIIICQDSDSPADFFIHKSAAPDSFKVTGIDKQKGKICCSKIANLILGNTPEMAAHLRTKSASFKILNPVQFEGMDFHLIVKQGSSR